jgi:prevent-host-death family protein
MAKTRSASDGAPRANVAQLKAHLSEYLRQVKSGHEVVITERGVPVARLTPLNPDERRATGRERLIRAGLLRPPAGPRVELGMPTGRAGGGRAFLEMLAREREEGF